jgi:hypothetical protein
MDELLTQESPDVDISGTVSAAVNEALIHRISSVVARQNMSTSD